MKIRTVSPILVEGPIPNASQEQLFHCSQPSIQLPKSPGPDSTLDCYLHDTLNSAGRAKILPNTNNTHTLLNKRGFSYKLHTWSGKEGPQFLSLPSFDQIATSGVEVLSFLPQAQLYNDI